MVEEKMLFLKFQNGDPEAVTDPNYKQTNCIKNWRYLL